MNCEWLSDLSLLVTIIVHIHYASWAGHFAQRHAHAFALADSRHRGVVVSVRSQITFRVITEYREAVSSPGREASWGSREPRSSPRVTQSVTERPCELHPGPRQPPAGLCAFSEEESRQRAQVVSIGTRFTLICSF